MAVAFNSFNRSPLGAFIESPLGARGGAVDPGNWFLESSGTDYWTSEDGVTWTLATAGVASPITVSIFALGVGATIRRLLSPTQYFDEPFSAASNMLYGGSSFSSLGYNLESPLRSGSNLIAFVVVTASSLRKLANSTDYGANWTEIASGGLHGRPIATQSGRILTLTVSGGNFVSYYSDDSGASWSNGTPCVIGGFTATAANDNRGLLYQKPNGTICFVCVNNTGATRKLLVSTDDGETWTDSGSTPGHTYIGDAAFAIDNTRTISSGGSDYYTDDDFTTRTAQARPVYMMTTDRKLYAYDTTADTIMLSTDGGQNYSTVTTDPTTLPNGSGGPLKYGMYRKG